MTKTKEVKYRYCKDRNDGEGEIVCIDDVTVENRYSRKYYCLSCGNEMMAYLRGNKTRHFHHKADCECNFETYLHILAKRLIKNKLLSSDTFPIVFKRVVKCSERDNCPFYNEEECCEEREVKSDLRTWNGKVVYDVCDVEKPYGGFKPDLLLSCSSKPNRDRLFIEIFKSHASEMNKLLSGYKIIETTQIKSEIEIEDIIKRGFVEGDNCETVGFNPLLPTIRKEDVPINRLALFKNGAIKIHKAIDYEIYCDQLHQKVYPNSILELNMKDVGIDIWGDCALNQTLDAYQLALVYLRKRGGALRNCILCKHRVFNEPYDQYLCKLYKVLKLESRSPNQTTANKCPRYEENTGLINLASEDIDNLFVEL